MIIYNLFPRLAGPFHTWEPHMQRASEMGFDWLFINPIQRPGKSGSLYSIVDYFDLNPVFTRASGKKKPRQQAGKVIQKASGLGLRVMADLVINHCAADSPLLKEHPEWFSWKSSDQVAHPFCRENGKKVYWRDLAQFNHRRNGHAKALYRYLLSATTFLADLGCKGFRCDAAYQIPSRLWKRLIRDVKKQYPGIVFVAETLGCQPDKTRETAQAGFDYIFNSSKWWNFHDVWLIQQYALTREFTPSISFPESHDTRRLCEELDGNLEGLKLRYLFAALFSAGVMMPMGFEFGFRRKLHVVETKPSHWESTDIDLMPFIKRVNRIKAQHPVFQEDAPMEILTYHNSNLLLLWKASTSSPEESLIILNKDIHNPQPFHVENLYDFVHAKTRLTDVSPEFPLDYIETPFSYDLRPGQAIVLMTAREPDK